jgi:hypothetical protein
MSLLILVKIKFSSQNLGLDKLTSSSTLSTNLIDPTSSGELYYERTC